MVSRQAEAMLNTAFGDFLIRGYTTETSECVALIHGELRDQMDVLVRVQSSCLLGESFHHLECDCRVQVHACLTRLAREPRSMFIYLNQEGRGVGLMDKIRALKVMQDSKCDTVEAYLQLGLKPDPRDYDLAAEVIVAERPASIRLLTNNERKLRALAGYGIAAIQEPLNLTQQEIELFVDRMAKKEDIDALISNLDTKRRKLEQQDLTESINNFLKAVDSRGGSR